MSTEWKLTDDGAQTYTIDSVDLGSGETHFKRGEELTLPCVFHEDSGGEFHLETYNRLLDNYNRYLSEDVVKTTTTSRGNPRYTQNLNPLSEASSYLFKLEAGDSLDYQEDWWVVITEMTDITRLRGAAETLEITFFPLKPIEDEDREEIVDEYEV